MPKWRFANLTLPAVDNLPNKLFLFLNKNHFSDRFYHTTCTLIVPKIKCNKTTPNPLKKLSKITTNCKCSLICSWFQFLKICQLSNSILRNKLVERYWWFYFTRLTIIEGLFTFSPPPQYCAGLPKKDETSVTTLRNLYWLFPYIHNFLKLNKLVSFFAKSLKGTIQDLN